MELIYIWLSRYNDTYHEEGFNFSGEYRFTYNHVTGLLDFKVNELFVKDFFRLRNQSTETHSLVQNVTAIVGENGAGKTSVLEYIKYELVYGRKVKRSKAINVFLDSRGMFHVYHDENVLVSPVTPEKFKLKSYNNEQDSKSHLYSPGFEALKNNTYIFFSPVADNRRNEMDKLRLINISTNYLLQEETKVGFLNHRYKEIFRQVQFLNYGKQFLSYLPNELRKSLPQNLEISINQNIDISDLPESLIEFINDMAPRLKEKGQNVTFLYNLRVSIANAALKEIFEINEDFLPQEDLDDLTQFVGLDLFKNFLKACEKYCSNHMESDLFLKNITLKISLQHKLSLYQLVESSRENGIMTYKNRRLHLPFDKTDVLFNLLNTYQQAVVSQDVFNFDWKDLSSGQKALLSMCARFFYVAYEPTLSSRLKENLIILIDEGEVYLHPQWQKELLYLLLEFLPALFFDPEKPRFIQLILTSNSPFIISDLPASHIIFLKQEGSKGTKVIDGLVEHKQTFASNIHSLFAHSFFMQDGLIGKLAKIKINVVIDILVNAPRNLFLQHKNEIRKIIEMIGEPVIRNKLVHMFDEKLKLNYLELDERISALEGELKSLRRQRRK